MLVSARWTCAPLPSSRCPLPQVPYYPPPPRSQVRELVACLRPSTGQQQHAAPDSSSSALTPIQACAALGPLVRRSSEAKQCMLAEGGVLALMELLEADNPKVGALDD